MKAAGNGLATKLSCRTVEDETILVATSTVGTVPENTIEAAPPERFLIVINVSGDNGVSPTTPRLKSSALYQPASPP